MLRGALTVIAVITAAAGARAFELSAYASSSVLSQGHWVKVSVTATGVHFIPASSLRRWGMTDPAKVKVYGYGGAAISNTLSAANTIDDLPAVQVYATSSGIYFYAQGPEAIAFSGSNRYYARNAYSNECYYFITADGGNAGSAPATIASEGTFNSAATAATSFTEVVQHERDLATLSQSGLGYVGEDFRYNRSQTFNIATPDYVEGTEIWCRTVFVTNSSGMGSVSISFDGLPTGNSANMAATSGNNYGTRAIISRSFTPSTPIRNTLAVGITYTPTGVVQAAHLDYIAINYQRYLHLPSGNQLSFTLGTTTAAIAGASPTTTHVWDVTSPHAIIGMNLSGTDSGAAFTNPYTGTRSYVAWSESMQLPQPKYVSAVANQDIHAYSGYPQMVIFTASRFASEAERLAAIHTAAPDNMTVLVIDQDQVFNEFSSGRRDPAAFRRMLKMLYDRGAAAGQPLRYALFFGRPTFDNRGITNAVPDNHDIVMPTWQTDESIYEGTSYTSDDIFAMLDDNSGASLGNSRLCIAVGRIPARSADYARTYVDKLISYNNNRLYSQWKNNVLLLADNGNSGIFMEHSEGFQANLAANNNGRRVVFNKVYIDAFNIQNSICAQGRERFHRLLDEGAVWFNYIGHGAINTLSSENILTNNDINNMYNKRWPVFFGATCTFSRWDGADMSGAEIMAFNPDGGAIATIAPSRMGGILSNGELAQAMGLYLFAKNSEGHVLTLGETLTAAKNTLLSPSSSHATNKLRYVLLGDPAMRIALPDNDIRLETINSEPVTEEAQVTIMGRQRVVLSGIVTDNQGHQLTDFDGTLSLTLYDAEYSTTSQGKPADGTDGEPVTFEEMGHKLYSGSGTISGGVFNAVVEMPSDVSDNFRPATLNMYAVATDGREAAGTNRDFYVYGFDEEAEPDDVPPTIDYAYLNHKSFAQGDIVNEQPTFIAQVSDDVSINMSMAGIGHQMTLKLDDRRTYSDVSLYFTPSTDGTPSGTIVYPLGEISEGDHSLAFRVWDAAGNSTTHVLQFYVQRGATPQLFDIYPDVSPATDHANFYITHNRPDAAMTVSLNIYDIAGRHIWSTTRTSRSDLWLSAPITWNLCDFAGRRVPRGIYIYQAIVDIDGSQLSTAAKRIAVTAP